MQVDDAGATLTGVPERGTEEGNVPVAQLSSRREAALQAIEDAVAQQRSAELGVPQETPPPEDEQLQTQMADEVISDPAGRKVRVKVDGVEQDVALDEVLRTFQKNSAADKRLEEATRLLREAQQRQQAQPPTAQEDSKTGTDLAPGDTADRKQLPAEVENQVSAALDAIYSGDQEAARAALVKVFEQQWSGAAAPTPVAAPQIDYNEVAQRVQQLREVDTALETIRRDYPDVIANPDIELLTAIKVNARVAEGTPRHVAMLESASEVYASLGKTPGRQQADRAGESRDEKLKQKAARDYIAPASVAAPSAEAPEPSNPADVIRQIAARRLGQSLALAGR